VCDIKSMTSSPARASVTPSPPAPTRSFLSRLKSPLSSKSRNFTEFYIQSDDPHRQYAPGDIISGTVVVKVVKPLRITHLVVSLHGYAQVFKNPNAPGDAYKNYSTTVGSGRGKRTGSYFGNGFVSLFEDEIVLCGEGRLAEGVYHFNFELEFPPKGLPSSIDFERGTVAYMLTATLTRPTTMSPATSCDTKVYLTDTVDIAPVLVPKPRVISLEPISRRTRAKSSRKRAGTSSTTVTATAPNEVPKTPTVPDAPEPRPLATPNGTLNGTEGPRSPSPSDASYESQMSSGGASGTEYRIHSVHTTPEGTLQPTGSWAPLKGKTITATIDVLKGGFLRGDQIPIKVAVNHTKHIRSLKGIIITLYRQARVDMHPALPVVPNTKGGKTKSEDYYPKSRTGLGGLSLSSAGSSHLFRKDLCQSFAPLFVDPRTLTAEVKCSVRVPDEAFPTISNVPGAMISFKYYVEVVVDLQGKLTGLDRMVANAGLFNVPSTAGGTSAVRDDSASSTFSTWGGNFVDTDQIRREKGVVSALFEVIIGTKDSERNGKQKETEQPLTNDNGVYEIPLNHGNVQNAVYGYDENYYDYNEDGQYYDAADSEAPGYDHYSGGVSGAYRAPPRPIAEEEGLSEKEQLRRAEARLLPSRPPDIESSGANMRSQHTEASAPIVPEDDDQDPPYANAGPSTAVHAQLPPPFRTASSPSIPSYRSLAPQHDRASVSEAAPPSSPIASSSHNLQTPTVLLTSTSTSIPPPHPPSPFHNPAPHYYSASSSSSSPPAHYHLDDKFELQRRRLEIERSVPPCDHENEDAVSVRAQPCAPSSTNSRSLSLRPSAPVLNEDDEGIIGAEAAAGGQGLPGEGSEALPVYQR